MLLRACAIAVAATALVACGRGEEAAPATAGPDILLVSIDSLRADHLGCYGYARPTSPTLDRWAAAGVRFEHAISTTSWTLPAHAALFTGLNDSAHGLVDNGLRLADAHVTLAEQLGAHGYQTAGFYGGPYLHPTFGLAQGFDAYTSCMSEAASAGAVRVDARSEASAAHSDVTGPRTLEAVARWLPTLDARPFFLFVHLWDVHYDYLAPPELVEAFAPGYDGPVDGRAVMQDPRIRADMPAADLQHLLALYDAEIRFTDDVLAKLFAQLEARGRLANTIVVVTADHGEEFFEHGGKGHQRTLFDEVLRVPLVIAWPGQLPAGRVVADPVRLIDVMPTLLSLAGLPIPAHVQGRDLSPLLRGGTLPSATALSELLVDGGTLRSLRSARTKWISPAPGRTPLGFDLERDPGEQRPRRPRTPEEQAEAARIEAEVAAALALRGRLGGDPERVAVDDSLWDRLRALGYVDDDGPPAEREEGR